MPATAPFDPTDEAFLQDPYPTYARLREAAPVHWHAPFDAIQAGSLLEIEPPDHTRIRRVVHDQFTPTHVRALSGKVEALCERLTDHRCR